LSRSFRERGGEFVLGGWRCIVARHRRRLRTLAFHDAPMSRTILHVIEDLKPESGGPTTVVVELAREQARAGHRVIVVCSRGPAQAEQRTQLAETFARAQIELVILDQTAAGSTRGAIVSILRDRRPDVTHLHGVWGTVIRWGSAEARASGFKYVISTHGMLHPDVLKQGRLKKYVYLTLYRHILASCSDVLALNEEERASIVARFKRPASVLANGIRTDLYDMATPSRFLDEHPEIQGSFTLFVGRLHPIKGIDLLIRSYAKARGQGLRSTLVVAGPDAGSLGELQALAKELGVAEQVRFLGPIYGDAKISAFAACSMFVHRPRFEGFGLTVVEALAAGKPVVTTDRCRLDGASEAGALIMTPDDDEAFAKAMLSIERDPAMAARLAEQGRAWIRSGFDWRSIREQADRIYDRVCSQGPHGA
jgi:glycosyltransferase involved in cell wall biosynthesis